MRMIIIIAVLALMGCQAPETAYIAVRDRTGEQESQWPAVPTPGHPVVIPNGASYAYNTNVVYTMVVTSDSNVVTSGADIRRLDVTLLVSGEPKAYDDAIRVTHGYGGEADSDTALILTPDRWSYVILWFRTTDLPWSSADDAISWSYDSGWVHH